MQGVRRRQEEGWELGTGIQWVGACSYLLDRRRGGGEGREEKEEEAERTWKTPQKQTEVPAAIFWRLLEVVLGF